MDKKHRKKLKRAAKKKKEKAVSQEAHIKLKKKMNMFDRLPEQCSSCAKKFPKTREAHMTWRVVVKPEQEKVWLFCPECQENVKKSLENNNEV